MSFPLVHNHNSLGKSKWNEHAPNLFTNNQMARKAFVVFCRSAHAHVGAYSRKRTHTLVFSHKYVCSFTHNFVRIFTHTFMCVFHSYVHVCFSLIRSCVCFFTDLHILTSQKRSQTRIFSQANIFSRVNVQTHSRSADIPEHILTNSRVCSYSHTYTGTVHKYPNTLANILSFRHFPRNIIRKYSHGHAHKPVDKLSSSN